MMRTAIALILAALGCLISFSAIGSSVAEDGRLVEPFFLIPIAWLLFLSGGMLAIATFIIRRSKARSTT
ncbi:MAG: hypothetical protein RL741_549 [Actinomycetota bacterium]